MRRQLGRHARIVALLHGVNAIRHRSRELGDDDNSGLHDAAGGRRVIVARAPPTR